ncbi:MULTISPECIES: hypothetical protein [Marinobacter]|jgi:hypothetical protein|uniref:hypothetical protein n=1 Tax=Marinobacter TaxID=2742 RepID=UPI00165EDD9E|nr:MULTISPECIES: hypothetical protein [Marinobacter]MBL3827331.1 hypothetical protein [Marinobacter sp. MC3]MBL3895837.1 hypothetical protein [Marinobacter sp. MW3]
MKKIIIAAAAATLFSTMATANSGLADRINEARTYPNKTVETKTEMMTCMKDMQAHKDFSGPNVNRQERKSESNTHHNHS